MRSVGMNASHGTQVRMLSAVADMTVNLLPTASHMMRGGYIAAVRIAARSLCLHVQGCQLLCALVLVCLCFNVIIM
jgi:hypothetical protein